MSSIKSLPVPTDAKPLRRRYQHVRNVTPKLCRSLAVEDYQLQSMPDCSPPKWHLAHTTWFFETFILKQFVSGYRPFHPQFDYLFNSYYDSVGSRWARSERGLLSRPTVAEVLNYREAVDEAMDQLLESDLEPTSPIGSLVELGLNHEEQHQELLLTDLKHALAKNPLHPAIFDRPVCPPRSLATPRWLSHPGGMVECGADGTDFHFDNESPKHSLYLQPFQISERLVTVEEYLEFLCDGGYKRPEFWLSDGWATVQKEQWTQPLYWEGHSRSWAHYTLSGFLPIELNDPICHLSFFEADAFARWAGCRLPTEFEWEVMATSGIESGIFLESEVYQPQPQAQAEPCWFGNVWEWTGSAYLGYPGFRAAPGAVGEYNGKFMCNQFVLRGGSCLTPRNHIRATYRNFFPPQARWQYSGIRLARDV